jgi:hypothetical protein
MAAFLLLHLNPVHTYNPWLCWSIDVGEEGHILTNIVHNNSGSRPLGCGHLQGWSCDVIQS